MIYDNVTVEHEVIYHRIRSCTYFIITYTRYCTVVNFITAFLNLKYNHVINNVTINHLAYRLEV